MFQQANSDAASRSPTTAGNGSPLPGISDKLWDRFSALKKRRELQSRRSTAKRIKDIKSSLASKIEAEFSSPDELAALHSNSVTLDQFVPKERLHDNTTESLAKAPTDSSCLPGGLQGQKTTKSSWLEIKPYFGINSHLSEDTGGGSVVPKSGLELSINRAVALGAYDTAEQLSDRLATREFGVKIVEAIDAKCFLTKRKHETELKKAAKKKKLAWGFEPKHRWETKGNM